MLVVGLTGAIASGKSATARLFAEAGAAVVSADAIVHRLYGGGPAAEAVGKAFPGVLEAGAVSRLRLAEAVTGDPRALARLEAIVHPFVREAEAAFLARAEAAGRHIAVLEIPLLFETGADRRVDLVVATDLDPAIARQRALARPEMTEAKLDPLSARLVSDAERRRRSHFLVDTSSVPAAQAAVADIMRALAALAAAR